MNSPLRISGHTSLKILYNIVARSYIITFSTLNRAVGIFSFIGADSIRENALFCIFCNAQSFFSGK